MNLCPDNLSVSGFIFCLIILAGCGRPESPDELTDWNTATYTNGPVTVTVATASDHITTARRLPVRITVLASENMHVSFPLPRELAGDFHSVRSFPRDPQTVGPGQVRWDTEYTLEPRLPGSYTIPRLIIKTQNEDTKKTYPVKTDEIHTKVTSVLPKSEHAKLPGKQTEAPGSAPGIREIAPPLRNLPISRAAAGLWVTIIVAVFAAMVMLCRRHLLLRHKSRELADARAVALRELSALCSKGHLARGEIHEFYRRMTRILRRYIQIRFSINVHETEQEDALGSTNPESRQIPLSKTSRELIGDLESGRSLDDPPKNRLRKLLKHCDLVKFARHRPPPETAKETLDTSVGFVKETGDTQERGE